MARRPTIEFERPIVELEERLEELKTSPAAVVPNLAREIKDLEKQLRGLKKKVYSSLTPWQKVQLARHPLRPHFSNYIENMFTDFIELHGDRHYSDDSALVGGVARFQGRSVVLVGHEKGRNVKDRLSRNFGMPQPEGYRKALRIFALAEKFRLPLISFIDTQGAYPGIGAEQRGQAIAIAKNLRALSRLRTPVVAVNIGEGGSGGALAIGVGDRLFMLENAYYSVITPEGCASILWDDASKAEEAAKALKLTADDLRRIGIVDAVIPEPLGGAHREPAKIYVDLREILDSALAELGKIPLEALVDARYKRIRAVGVFEEDRFAELSRDIHLVEGADDETRGTDQRR